MEPQYNPLDLIINIYFQIQNKSQIANNVFQNQK